MAATSGIADVDGKMKAEAGDAGFAYTYQWVRVASDMTEADISGETSDSYVLAAADNGKQVKVKVRFTDDGNTAEGPLTSAAYPSGDTVGTNAAPASADKTVTTAEDTAYTFGASDFAVQRHRRRGCARERNGGDAAGGGNAGARRHGCDGGRCGEQDPGPELQPRPWGQQICNWSQPTLSKGAVDALRLHVCDRVFNLIEFELLSGDVFLDITGLDWTLVATRDLTLSLPPNNAPTGKPVITSLHPAQVGRSRTLRAGEIVDADGRSPHFEWEWIRVDADGASNPTVVQTRESSGRINIS